MKGADDLVLNEPDSLDELYERFAPIVFRVALRITQSPDEAEDVVQDVFLGLPEVLHTFDGRGSFTGWIGKVAARVSLMRLRRVQRRRAVLTRVPPLRGFADNSASIEARITLERALGRISAELRTVFVLKEIEGLEHAEIAALLGISVSASETRLYRARKQLRKYMEDLS